METPFVLRKVCPVGGAKEQKQKRLKVTAPHQSNGNNQQLFFLSYIMFTLHEKPCSNLNEEMSIELLSCDAASSNREVLSGDKVSLSLHHIQVEVFTAALVADMLVSTGLLFLQGTNSDPAR